MKSIFSISFLVLLLTVPASADIFSSVNFSTPIACLSIDGVPITDPAEIAKCCSGSNLNPTCHAGYNTTIGDAALGSFHTINLAQQTANIAAELNGATADLTDNTPTTQGLGITPDLSAMVASGVSSAKTTGGATGTSAQDSLAYNQKAPSDSEDSSGASGGGLGLGSANSANGKNKDGTAGNKDGSGNASAGGFATGGEGSAKNGAAGSGNGSVGTDGFGDQHFASGDAKAESNTSLNDEDGIGSANDPSDYFNRIDKSANIFKIVSKRYMQKKSLWKAPLQ